MWGSAIYEQKCQRTPGCYLGFLHTGRCHSFTVPNKPVYEVPQTFYGHSLQNIRDMYARIAQLEQENEELKRKADPKAAAAHLWNEETQSYQIPLSSPGRIEWPEKGPYTANPTGYAVKYESTQPKVRVEAVIVFEGTPNQTINDITESGRIVEQSIRVLED